MVKFTNSHLAFTKGDKREEYSAFFFFEVIFDKIFFFR